MVAALASGDRSAAESLARGTYSMVYASLCKMSGDPELAADLTQETYNRAWAALGKFDGRARFSSWLYRIAFNTYMSHVRRPRLLSPLDENAAAALPSSEVGQDDAMALSQRHARLRDALLGLPDNLRWTVTARYWSELPVVEIARLEGVSNTAIRKRLRRAEKLLRQTLKEQAVKEEA